MFKFIMFPLMAVALGLSVAVGATSAPTIKFNFRQADITKVIEEYAKASGQKVIIDPQVRGKATIINSEPIELDEAFNQLSTALMVNGLAFSKQGDTWLVMQARQAQRSMIDVVETLPPLRPDKMVIWMVKLKHTDADSVNKELRILTSTNGELVPYRQSNTIIISDYVSNLYRVAAILKQLDQPRAGMDTKVKSN